MSLDDIDKVMVIERASYQFPWTRGNFRDCIESGYYARVLVEAGVMAGYVVMSMGAGEAHVLNICVAPERQRQGLGRALLHHLEQVALENSVDMMLLEVRVSNQPAIRLYDSMGFNELGQRRNYYPAHGSREDALILARHLI
jgi:ribosomal-protein-alanine N-acetyltransferase